MRTVVEALDQAQNAPRRQPLGRVTVRDVRLRFAHFATVTNPWGLADAALQNSHAFVYGDVVTLANGHVLRAWADAAGDLLVQTIADPSLAANWSHATNPWASIATTPNLGITQENCGLVASGNNARVFYDTSQAEGGAIGLHYRDSAESWATAHDTGLNIFGSLCFAPVAFDELYGFSITPHNTLALYHLAYDGAAWSYSEAPYRLYPDRDHAWWDLIYGSYTFFDAFVLGGINHIVFTNQAAGHSYVVRHQQGVWSEPRLLIPDDATHFTAYRVSVINGVAYLSGRVTRANDPRYSPAWDAYLATADGLNWSALARDSFLCAPELRGKVLLSGNYVYYPGLANVWRAPATYPLGVDPSGLKLTLTDRLVGIHQTYPAAGLAPEADLDVANADDAFSGSSVLADGSEAWIETGYQTSEGALYQLTEHISLDSVQDQHADGSKNLTVSGRAAAVKRLKDWNSPFYWTLPSQLRLFNGCTDLNGLNLVRGAWSLDSQNLALNGSFETDLADWIDTATGSAAGTRARSSDQASLGQWSYRLVKTGGAATDKWGTHQDFGASGGVTYRISVDVFAADLAGGASEYALHVHGVAMGPGGTNIDLDAVGTGVGLSFQTLTLEVPVIAAGTLFIYVWLSDCTTGTLYVDNLMIVQEQVGYLRYTDQAELPGLLISTDPFAAGDFDIQATFTRVYTTPAHGVNFGLVGQYVDALNYNAFILGNAGIVALVAVRSGVQQVLAKASYTLTEGVAYTLRLVHRGGHFWGYIKDPVGHDWLTPQVDWRWDDTPGPVSDLCHTSDGTGPVGIRALIRPYRFTAAAFDEAATVLTAEAVGDLAAFPSAGTIQCEQEQMTYAAVSGLTLTGLVRGVNDTTAAPHAAGSRVTLFADDEVQVDNWQVSDTEPNYTTESLLKRVCAMAGSFQTGFADVYPRAGTADLINASIVASPDFGAHFLANIDLRNVDLSFDWLLDQWGTGSFGKVGAVVRASTQSLASCVGYVLNLEYLAGPPDLYFASLWYFNGGGLGTAVELDAFRLQQIPLGLAHTLRVVVRDDFFVLYCDDTIMGTFHDTRVPADQAHNYVGLVGVGDLAANNIRIPELFEWRDTAWVDNEAVALDVIDTVILDDRPVYLVARADDTLYFSLFDTRQTLLNPGTEDGSFGDILYSDQAATQDSDLVSMLRIYAVTILEELDSATAAQSGFVFAARQMPRAENVNAASYFPRIFRRALEVHGARTQELPANVGLEIEDQFKIAAVPSGSNRDINTSLPAGKLVIVNDMEVTLTEASFSMKLGLRTKQP